jgi:hypothetical protein
MAIRMIYLLEICHTFTYRLLVAGLYADVSGVCGSSCDGDCCILESFCLGGGGILIITRKITVTITNMIEIMVCFFIRIVFTFPINQ